MFQDSTQFYLKPQNMTSSHSYFFFYPPDQEVHKCPNKLASDKHALSLIPDRLKRSAPTSSLLNKSVCYRQTTNDNCGSNGRSLHVFQICLPKSQLFFSLIHEIKCAYYLLIWLFFTADTRTQWEFSEIPQRGPKAGGNHRSVEG